MRSFSPRVLIHKFDVAQVLIALEFCFAPSYRRHARRPKRSIIIEDSFSVWIFRAALIFHSALNSPTKSFQPSDLVSMMFVQLLSGHMMWQTAPALTISPSSSSWRMMEPMGSAASSVSVTGISPLVLSLECTRLVLPQPEPQHSSLPARHCRAATDRVEDTERIRASDWVHPLSDWINLVPAQAAVHRFAVLQHGQHHRGVRDV